MLKDLDQRQASQVNNPGQSVVVATKDSSKKVLILSLTFIVIMNVAGIFAWQLYTENQALKGVKSPVTVNQQGQQLAKAVESIINSKKTKEKINALMQQTQTEQSRNTSQAQQTAQNNQAFSNTEKSAVEAKAQRQQANSAKANTDSQGNIENNVNIDNNELSVTEPKASTQLPISDHSSSDSSRSGKSANLAPVPKAKLSISRVQLTPEQLVLQKFTKAEQAIANNEIKAAEQLFEDILLIKPTHHSARKQLAALWFGRQANQAALNLLSNGIALAPNNIEYRMMQARIYLKLGQHTKAVDTLLRQASIRDVEYQALLANTAQQIAQYQVAIAAYTKLTDMELHIGRWWLGLAVAYDSDSQFTHAAASYQKALATGDLSDRATEFSRKRLQVLGE